MEGRHDNHCRYKLEVNSSLSHTTNCGFLTPIPKQLVPPKKTKNNLLMPQNNLEKKNNNHGQQEQVSKLFEREQETRKFILDVGRRWLIFVEVSWDVNYWKTVRNGRNGKKCKRKYVRGDSG